MAKSKISVSEEKLEGASVKIEEYVADYKKTYNQLFAEINAMSANWQGPDNLAYTSQIEGFKDDFENMANLMSQYAAGIKQVAANYKAQKNAVIEGARKLRN